MGLVSETRAPESQSRTVPALGGPCISYSENYEETKQEVEPLALGDHGMLCQVVPVPAPQNTTEDGDLSSGSGLEVLPQAHCPVL